MSKLYNIPVKTLRYYDEIGLFKPFEVDPNTGYRYYHIEQFQILDTIGYLKTMGVPLKEIIKRVEHSTVEEFLAILKEYEKINQEKMVQLIRVNRHLTSKIAELSKAQKTTNIGQPFIEVCEEKKIIEVKGQFKDLVDVEHVLRKVKKKINHVSPVMIGKVGRILSMNQLMSGEIVEFQGIFILLEEDNHYHLEDHKISTFPSGMYATLYIRHSKVDSTENFQQLLNYVHEQGYQTDGPFLFRRIVDPFISHREDELLSQIQIRIYSENNEPPA